MAKHKFPEFVSTVRQIWQDGVAAVDGSFLIQASVRIQGSSLLIGSEQIDLNQVERIRVVGAGKAAGRMANGLELALGPDVMWDKRVSGWVNIPEEIPGAGFWFGSRIWQFPARPAGENLPTSIAFGATLLIEDIVRRTGPRELCLGLFSGGGSALLTHPPAGVGLEDKRKTIRWLSGQGCTIQELNLVRQHLSRVKGGWLADGFPGGQMTNLFISDVIDNDLSMVASGPTVLPTSQPADAVELLKRLDPRSIHIPRSVHRYLARTDVHSPNIPEQVSNVLIGGLQNAVDASADSAEQYGFQCEKHIQSDLREQAEQAGRRMAGWILRHANSSIPRMLVSGGEPVVTLPGRPGIGGRNSHLVLAALDELSQSDAAQLPDFVILSGGTDAEDGTSPATGAWISNLSVQRARTQSLDIAASLRKHDAYTFFKQRLGFGTIPEVGRGNTNVGDLRLAAVLGRPT